MAPHSHHDPGDRQRILSPAVVHAFDILDFLATNGPVSAARIVNALHLPRSSTYQLLDVLVRQGLIIHFPERREFGLGIHVFELGSAFMRQHPLARLAQPVLAHVVDVVHENGHLAVLHGNEVIYVLEERAVSRSPLVTGVGVRLPSHLTASGRAMLAYLPDAQLRALYPSRRSFIDRNGVGPKSLSELQQLLANVRDRGFAEEHGDITTGFDSYAVAVFDYNHFPVAGIAITFVASSLNRDASTELITRLMSAGRELTRRMGG